MHSISTTFILLCGVAAFVAGQQAQHFHDGPKLNGPQPDPEEGGEAGPPVCPVPPGGSSFEGPCVSSADCLDFNSCMDVGGVLPGCTGTCVCFPGHATVTNAAGQPVRIDELRVGDMVRCFRQSTHSFGLCPVLTFLTAAPTEPSPMLRLEYRAESNASATGVLELSDDHFLWAADVEPLARQELPFGRLVEAGRVPVGGRLVLEVDGVATPVKVTKVSPMVSPSGAYAFVVPDGAMPLVNGLVVSSYAVEDPTVNFYLYSTYWTSSDEDLAKVPEYGVAGKDLSIKVPHTFGNGFNAYNGRVIKGVSNLKLDDAAVAAVLKAEVARVQAEEGVAVTEQHLKAALQRHFNVTITF